MISHHSVKFGGHRHCGNGDIMVLTVEEQDSTRFCLNLALLFIPTAHGLKAHGI